MRSDKAFIPRLRRLAAAVAVAIGIAGPALASEPAVDVAAAFCKTRIAGDADAVKPLLTPSLMAVVTEAEERNQVIAQGNPDEKPPLGDGIPYQSYPDLPDSCEPGEPAVNAGRIEVPLLYGFAKTPKANWTDRLLLVEHDGKLLIDDVRYQGSADGSGVVGLREILHGMFDQ